MPKSMGFHPADLILSRESPAPIRKRVSTSIDLEMLVIERVIRSGIVKKLFNRIATTNRKINHGIFRLLFSPLNRKTESSEIGIIQSALASFTVVATLKASSPYA